ncbi:uncharacterized protein JCM6883_002949 [Sporobolomyces salmoneus]|uniref:uncharacterized protein n=1 Tax=Sporobolomyces salmoneus TaxID=183962 RepID=UPI003177CE36
MPIPFIPHEIVSEILSQFHYEDENAETDGRVNEAPGKATSLVCRSWRPLGQALRWSKISIEPSSSSSLLDHLVSHPHIANLVQDMKLLNSHRDMDQDVTEQVPEDYAPSRKLLSLLVELKNVSLDFANRNHFGEFLIVCSRLPKLAKVRIVGPTLYITRQLKTALLKGFPVLKTLDLSPMELVDLLVSNTEEEEEEDDETGKNPDIASIPSKSQLRHVELQTSRMRGGSDPDPARSMFDVVKSAFDWSRVTTCSVGGPFITEEIISDLARQTNLAKLQLSPIRLDLRSILSTLIVVLPQMINIRFLVVEKTFRSGEDVLVSPIKIRDFLQLIPPNLDLLVLRQFAFDPYDDSFEFPDAFEFEAEGKEPLRVLETLAAEDYPLVLAEYETDSGKQWCRVYESESSSEDEIAEGENSGAESD